LEQKSEDEDEVTVLLVGYIRDDEGVKLGRQRR
jgi:hypothetical protein